MKNEAINERNWTKISARGEALVLALNVCGKTFLTFAPIDSWKGIPSGPVVAIDEIDIREEVTDMLGREALAKQEKAAEHVKVIGVGNE